MKKNNESLNKNQVKPYEFPKNCAEFLGQQLTGEIGYVSMGNESRLESLGIYPLDIVIYRKTSEILENELQAISLPNHKCGELSICHLYENFGDISIIHADGDTRRYKRKEVVVKGVVVGVIRSLKTPVPGSEMYVPEAVAEITAVCDQCQDELTGTPEFIKAQGWDLRCGKTRCLKCDLL